MNLHLPGSHVANQAVKLSENHSHSLSRPGEGEAWKTQCCIAATCCIAVSSIVQVSGNGIKISLLPEPSEISTGLCRLGHGAEGVDRAFSGLSSTPPWCNNMKKQHCHPSDFDHFQAMTEVNHCQCYKCCYCCYISLQFIMVQAVWFQSRGFVERRLPPCNPHRLATLTAGNMSTGHHY